MASTAPTTDDSTVEFQWGEELEEAASAPGWSTDYRQLRRGRFSARLSSSESGNTSIATERFEGYLDIGCRPPPGFLGIFLLDLDQGQVAVRDLRRAIRTGVEGGSFDGEAESHLIAEVALCLAEASSRNTAERLASGTPAAVAREAREYVEQHFRGPIRLEDLCTHVGVSLRTLQRCFETHFQVCPTEFLRARRMNEARRILAAADLAADQVTSIAMDVGFTHLGRFAVDYRTFFGESPSQTLAARRLRARSS